MLLEKQRNYEKHALRVFQVIAVHLECLCKHGIFIAARVNKKNPSSMNSDSHHVVARRGIEPLFPP